MSDAQVLTTALVAARYFSGNCVLGQRYMEAHWGQNSLDKSGINRHLHRLADTLAGLFAPFGNLLKERHTESRYVIDSFPVAVCHNTRIPRCKLLKNKAYHGRCASKRSWFYGSKVQVLATTDGIPVDYYIHVGSEADQTGLRCLGPDLPEGSVLTLTTPYQAFDDELSSYPYAPLLETELLEALTEVEAALRGKCTDYRQLDLFESTAGFGSGQ